MTDPVDMDAVKDWLWAFAQQSLDYAILLADREGKVLWASPGAAWILAATTAEIVGGPLSRFFTPEDVAFGIPEHERSSAVRQGSSDDDRWMLRADGSRYWSAGRTVALARRDGTWLGYLKIFRDQTELKMRIRALGNRALLLDADRRSRAHAVATIARELTTPSGAHDTQELQRLALDLEQALQAPDAPPELQLEPLRLDEELAAAVALAARHARRKPDVEILLPPGRPIEFEGDRRRLRDALVALLDNAMRAIAAGGRIWINASIESGQALVRIEDNGAGMDAHTQAAVFALLTEAEPADAQQLGSGLSMARFLVELHGGTIQARSAGPGKGSEFSLRLPLSQAGRVLPAPL
jgi:PAS domain S-box-containing protein